MADEIEIKIPDIGGATEVDVIEVLVKPGDRIDIDTPLITLESDKASMEIPSPQAGTIANLSVKVGDKVAEGNVILTLNAEGIEPPIIKKEKENQAPKEEEKRVEKNEKSELAAQRLEVRIPDIGGTTGVDVIDIMVNAGQTINKDQALITLEGDKATMDIPAPAAGIVEEVVVKLNDKVSQGDLILIMSAEQDLQPAKVEMSQTSKEEQAPVPVVSAVNLEKTEIPVRQIVANSSSEYGGSAAISGSPAVRRMARELGVNLAEVKGTGRKSRISKEDIQSYIKSRLSEKPSTGGFSLPSMPAIDFSKFGAIEVKPLNKIKRLTGVNVHRSWITIPHVTQFDEADITDLEAFRKSESANAAQAGYKLTILAFVTKVVAKALAVYPQFNASLDAGGENLIYKHYVHIGIAVETPNGLVVPVIKDANQLSIEQIALEMARLSAKARDKGLMPADMSGGCFTISSLGGIGGTAFTPIVNSPEVAILGLSRSSIKPVFLDGEFKPRLMLPLSLSYDHRVIDGAEAARFTRYISDALADIRRILL